VILVKRAVSLLLQLGSLSDHSLISRKVSSWFFVQSCAATGECKRYKCLYLMFRLSVCIVLCPHNESAVINLGRFPARHKVDTVQQW